MATNYLQSLEEMYKNLYNSKNEDLQNQKKKSLAELDNQQAGISNQYTELLNSLNAKKQQTQAQYQGLYTGLNNQAQEGKEAYYNDRNNAALGNVQNVQAIRDYMAKNNLMSSGENPDAIMRASTNYNNNLGNIYNNEQKFNRGIADQRNNYAAQEQGAYQDIENQIGASEREKAQKIAEILNNRRMLEDSTLSGLQSYKDELEAKKLNDINSYNLQQEQYAQQLAQARASAARSSAKSSSSAADKTAAAQQKALQDQYNKYYDTGWTMKNKGYTDPNTGDYVDRYGNDYLVDWVSNLDLPGDYKAKLANDLGLQDKQSVVNAQKKAAVTSIPYWGINPLFRR